MFTGIIEAIGKVQHLTWVGDNLNISISTDFVSELKIDQSVSHNGVCLTVVDLKHDMFTVTAINETLEKTNLHKLEIGSKVNLERAMKLGDRLDGHIVQGHVDQTAKCISVKQLDGSWLFSFEYDPSLHNITVEKGSVTINGVSLTVVQSNAHSFSVAIIPYTYEHTNFCELGVGDLVNIEFDVIGKYVARLLKNY